MDTNDINNIRLIDFTKPNYSDSSSFITSNNVCEILHLDEFLRAKSLIRKTLENLNGYTFKETEIKRTHNTVSVLGTRGSGKTSFLMSLREEIIQSAEFDDILFLDIIDPTLIEIKEHIFVNIVSRIVSLVRMRINKSTYGCTYDKCSDFRIWEEYLSDLSGSLPCIDGIGKNSFYDEWEDSDYILEKGLLRAKAANNLELNFNRFVFKSLQILNKKCIVIAFDDIDTDFTKGWDILECIRKYLTSPMILPIVSGDISLYSVLIRKRQWDNIYNGNTLDVRYKKESYIQMADHLESQYMLKVLKPENRITLSSLYDKVVRKGYRIMIRYRSGNDKDITSLYQAIISEIGIQYGKQSIYNMLLSLPIRTQVRLMKAYVDSLDNKADLASHILDIFWSDVANRYSHPDELEEMHNSIPLFDILYQNNKLHEAGQFLPFTNSSVLNNALVTTGALYNNLLKKDSYLIFDYMLRIGMFFSSIQDISYTADKTSPSIKGLVEYAHLLSDIGLRKQSAMIICYLYAIRMLNSGQRGFVGDIIRLKNLESINNVYAPTSSSEDFAHQSVAYLPLIGIRNGSSLNHVYSFSLLLASLGELLRTINSTDSIKSFAFKMQTISQLREFAFPSFSKVQNDSNEPSYAEDYDGVFIDDDSAFAFKKLYSPLLTWAKSYNGGVSVHVLGRISTRFYSTVQRIPKYNSLADIFNRYIVLFLNSVLVEDAIEHNVIVLNRNNPITKNNILIKNIKYCFNLHDKKTMKLEFSRWVMSCPLLHCYMENDLKDIIRENLNLGQEYKDLPDVYENLSKVTV